jgi:ribosomal protein S18 acetylase RimI-like enzyme
MDIALLPEYRNRHIGGGLIREVLEEAHRERKRVSLHVEETNPAKGLYERMGFAVVGEVSFYQLMQWEPYR